MIQLYDMNYVTTNVRIPEADYLRLKAEAAQKRISFSAVVRNKIGAVRKRSPEETEELISEFDKIAKKLGKKLKGFDIVAALREMRYETHDNS